MTTAYQQQTREAWDAIAAGFDAHMQPIAMSLAERALRRVSIGPGTRVLDVAAGTGAVAIPAARLGAEVVATDISPAMIEHLNARARTEALSNLEGRVMDGHALDLEDDTFDVSASQNGVSLFPDLPRGLSEMARATRPGGKVMVIAFGPVTRQEWLGCFAAAIQAVMPGFTGPPMDPPPLPFQVADPAELARQLTAAGLRDVRVDTIQHGVRFQSGADMFGGLSHSNPIGAEMVADLTPRQRADVEQVLDGMLRERSGGEPGGVLGSEINIAVGSA